MRASLGALKVSFVDSSPRGWCVQVNAEVRFLLARLDFTDFYKEQ